MFKDQSVLLEDIDQLPNIDTFVNPFYDSRCAGIIKIIFGEFTCVCPKTGYPDFASIDLYYVPNELCVELKSWKLFLNSFRMVGTFHETVIKFIYDKLVYEIDPKWLLLVGDFFPRGNVNTTVMIENLPENRPATSVFIVKKYDQHSRSF